MTVTAVPPRPLGGNLSWAVAGNFAYVASQFVVMVVIARLLGPADVGTFSLALSIVAPVLVFAQLQLRIVLSTDVRYKHPLTDFVRIRAWTAGVMIVVVWLIAAVSDYSAAAVQVIVLLGVAKGFDALCDVLYGYHQRREDMRVVAVGQVVNGLLSVALVAAALWFTQDLVVGMIGFAVASAVTLVGWVLPTTVRIRRRDTDDPRGQPRRQRSLIWKALPLAVVLFLSALSTSIPRLFIEHSLGAYELGIFAGVSYLIIAGANLINSLGNAISPRLARLYVARDAPGFRRFVLASIAFGAGIALVGAGVAAIVGGPLLSAIYTPDYRPYGNLLVALFVAAAFGYAASFAVGAATAAQRFTAQIPVFVVVAAIGVVSCATLIPRWGLNGAVIATGVMAAVQLLGCGMVVKRAVEEIGND